MIIAQRAKKMRILSAVLLALVLTVVPKTADAYVLMGEQVLELMVKALGQADTLERKIEISKRCYEILTKEVGFPPEDIIFDPNIFAIGTGLPEHDDYAVAFIESVRRIKAALDPAGLFNPGRLYAGL